MVERGTGGVPLRVDQNEFTTAGGGLAIPEPARLLNPVRVYVGNIQDMSQISRKKLLGPFIILLLPLRSHSRRKNRRQQRDRKYPRSEVKNFRPLEEKSAGCENRRPRSHLEQAEAPYLCETIRIPRSIAIRSRAPPRSGCWDCP